jgi:hypothetical protein
LRSFSLSLWLKQKNFEIRYRTRELSAFSGEGRSPPWSLLVPSSVLTHLHLFSCFSHPEFQNPNFLVPLHNCSLHFDSSQKMQKSDLARSSPTMVLLGPLLNFDTSSHFQPFLSPWVLECKLYCAST